MKTQLAPKHPAYFQPPYQRQRLSPETFREALPHIANRIDRISKMKLAKHGYNDLQLLADEAPDSFEELARAVVTRPYGDKFPIYHGHCEKTILHANCANTWYRAWHDIVHLEVGGKFTLPGERVVVNTQMQEMEMLGFSEDECNIVWYDIMGQLLYFHKYRDYVQEQRAFVEACVCKGLQYALAYRW